MIEPRPLLWWMLRGPLNLPACPPGKVAGAKPNGAVAGCVGPTLLHPVKGDACGRFSANGFG